MLGLQESALLLPVAEEQPAEGLQRHQPAHPPMEKTVFALIQQIGESQI